ncbi:MAG: hypothetical protein ACQESP_01195 [Candidatus Muiribacteriota bacterium]
MSLKNDFENSIEKKLSDSFKMKSRDRLDYILQKKAQYIINKSKPDPIKYSLSILINKSHKF